MAEQRVRVRRADDDASIPLERRRRRPNREAAEAAVRTLIKRAGDDPAREGLLTSLFRADKGISSNFSGFCMRGCAVPSRFYTARASWL
jgi:GTP cyclohydrolase I